MGTGFHRAGSVRIILWCPSCARTLLRLTTPSVPSSDRNSAASHYPVGRYDASSPPSPGGEALCGSATSLHFHRQVPFAITDLEVGIACGRHGCAHAELPRLRCSRNVPNVSIGPAVAIARVAHLANTAWR